MHEQWHSIIEKYCAPQYMLICWADFKQGLTHEGQKLSQIQYISECPTKYGLSLHNKNLVDYYFFNHN